jgi:hypothetical protein
LNYPHKRNELPKKKLFAAMISDLQKRIKAWNRFNVDSKEAVAEKGKAKKDALWKCWDLQTKEERYNGQDVWAS